MSTQDDAKKLEQLFVGRYRNAPRCVCRHSSIDHYGRNQDCYDCECDLFEDVADKCCCEKAGRRGPSHDHECPVFLAWSHRKPLTPSHLEEVVLRDAGHSRTVHRKRERADETGER